jgi:hypothetical protein
VRAPALLLAVALLSGGCAGRGLLPEAESREAVAFFAGAEARYAFPVASSWSGVIEQGGDAFPFIAGIEARSARDESVGLYDPLGRAVMMLQNDGAALRLEAGPVAGALAPLGGKKAPAEGLSIGRILDGAPGFPVGPGECSRSGDGGWRFSDARQALRTDPGRRYIAAAEYQVAGRSLAVSYPGREAGTPPPVVKVDGFGATIELRRDAE